MLSRGSNVARSCSANGAIARPSAELGRSATLSHGAPTGIPLAGGSAR